MEDKYIGIILAMAGTLAIGTSFIITKKVRRLYVYGSFVCTQASSVAVLEYWILGWFVVYGMQCRD